MKKPNKKTLKYNPKEYRDWRIQADLDATRKAQGRRRKRSNKALEYANNLRPMLRDLYWSANNPNVCGAVPGAVMTAQRDGWEFGCKVEDHDLFMRRKVFIKAEQPFSTIPERDKDPVMAAVFDEMLEQGAPTTSIEVLGPNVVMIVQDFVPILLQKTSTARGHIKINDSALLEAGRMH